MPEAAAGRQPTASERRRMYRDLALSLRRGLRDAAAGFSFLRLRGLRALLRALRSAADADPRLFRDSQAIRDLQVVPVLFEHSLRKANDDAVVTVGQVLGIEPARLRTPPRTPRSCSRSGCSKAAASSAPTAPPRRIGTMPSRYGLATVILNILMTRGILEQTACLDTLLALLVDCSENLMDFKEQEGLNNIALIVKDTNRDDQVRCATLQGAVAAKLKILRGAETLRGMTPRRRVSFVSPARDSEEDTSSGSSALRMLGLMSEGSSL
ncbi:hypothetical protein PR202_ga07615 [Eleusine coracana subsp. coracana]|uniref:Uncharacterized protein n=1 Tax=Eleusine coracana subsp. coracana TaxID=191504 RepID=A0AAV5BYY7_ELECO|nr:hypothetical protein PR202_ga07615 [Eleusine coracana subsp. coracana]